MVEVAEAALLGLLQREGEVVAVEEAGVEELLLLLLLPREEQEEAGAEEEEEPRQPRKQPWPIRKLSRAGAPPAARTTFEC